MLRVCCFIVVFILCACNNRTRGETPLTVNNDLYVVDIDHADRENIVYSAVFGKLKTVVLGANDSVLIGEISKMQVGRDGIFVLDRNQTKGVYLFSNGLINMISGRGNLSDILRLTPKAVPGVIIFSTMKGLCLRTRFSDNLPKRVICCKK